MSIIQSAPTIAPHSRLDFSGKASLTIPGVTEFGPSSAQESLNFPQSIGAGYAYRPNDRLKLETDLIWTDWQTVDQLKIHSADPHFNNQSLPAHWESGFTARFGAEYKLDQHWVIRGGYAWGENAVPESTFSPLVPDSNYHLFAAGVGYETPNWDLSLATEYIFRERRHIHNDVNSPTVDGTWDNTITD